MGRTARCRCRQQAIGVNLPGAIRGSSDGVFSSYWPTGVVGVIRADGGAEWIEKTIDPDVLRRRLVPNENQP